MFLNEGLGGFLGLGSRSLESLATAQGPRDPKKAPEITIG